MFSGRMQTAKHRWSCIVVVTRTANTCRGKKKPIRAVEHVTQAVPRPLTLLYARCFSATKSRTTGSETMASGWAAGRQPGVKIKNPGVSAPAVTFTASRTGDSGAGWWEIRYQTEQNCQIEVSRRRRHGATVSRAPPAGFQWRRSCFPPKTVFLSCFISAHFWLAVRDKNTGV